ncbi:MAG: hypothetical protein ABII68_01450 [Pseudomonadota bacterium]
MAGIGNDRAAPILGFHHGDFAQSAGLVLEFLVQSMLCISFLGEASGRVTKKLLYVLVGK